MNKSKNIIYVGSFRFPDKDAAAKRVLGIGKALKNMEYNVVFAGGEQGDHYTKSFQGFSYFSQNELDLDLKSLYDKIISFFNSGNNTVKWLNSYIKENEIEAVILYNSSYLYIRKIKAFCDNNNIQLIPDITEWNDSSHLPGGKYGIVSLDNYLKMNFCLPKFQKLIVISKYLDSYYKGRGCDTVIVPPLNVEETKRPFIGFDGNFIDILYAGSPGKKDDIYKVIKTFNENHKVLDLLRFHLVGINLEQFKKKYSDIGFNLENVFFYGRIPYKEVLCLYQKMSFSFIIRPDKKFANAGFPTKFVESLEMGVPVISTKTSDIGDYLITKSNGILLSSISKTEILETLHFINRLDKQDILEMKENALLTSEKFNIERFQDRLKKIIEKK